MQKLKLLFNLLILDCAKAIWNISEEPWHCNSTCLQRISRLETSEDGCLKSGDVDNHLFEMFNIDNTSVCVQASNSRQSVCLRRNTKSNKYFVGTCNVNVIDHRIPCRKAQDRMNWYRGPHSVSFSGKSCIRWDEASADIPFSNFSSFFGPSIMHPLRRFSTGIHSMENQCRNPNNWQHGPWCFVKNGIGGIEREACFEQCEQYNQPEMCLAKKLFPYMLPSKAPFFDQPDTNAIPTNIKDLSDIIDVQRVVRFSRYVRPMFIPIYFLDYIRNYPFDVSTRLRCYQNGPQTRIAGPWTYSDVAVNPFSSQLYWIQEMFKSSSADRMDRERTFRGDGGPRYSLWRPCFLACEDTNIECWPVQQKSVSRQRFPYYGPRNHDFEGNQCVPPVFAYQILVANDQNSPVESTYLKIFRSEILSNKAREKKLKNLFAISNGRLMATDRCFTLGDFLIELHEGARKQMAIENFVYRMVMRIGAGCFVEVEYRKKIEYRACFQNCDCQKDVQPPVILAENLCLLESKCKSDENVTEADDYMEQIEKTVSTHKPLMIGDVTYSRQSISATIFIQLLTIFGFISVTILGVIFMRKSSN